MSEENTTSQFRVELVKCDVTCQHLDIPTNDALLKMQSLMKEDDFYLNLINIFVQYCTNNSKGVPNIGDTIQVLKDGAVVHTVILDEGLMQMIGDAYIMGTDGKAVTKSLEYTAPISYKLLEDFNKLNTAGKLFFLYHGFIPKDAIKVLEFWYGELDHTKLDDEWKAQYQKIHNTVTSWKTTYTDESRNETDFKHIMNHAWVLTLWLRDDVVNNLCSIGKKTAVIIMETMEHMVETDALEFMDQEVVAKLREEFPAQKAEVLKYYTPYRKK